MHFFDRSSFPVRVFCDIDEWQVSPDLFCLYILYCLYFTRYMQFVDFLFPRHFVPNMRWMIHSRDVKRRSNFQTSNYMFEFEFGIVTFDNRFHLAQTLELKCCWRVISDSDSAIERLSEARFCWFIASLARHARRVTSLSP